MGAAPPRSSDEVPRDNPKAPAMLTRIWLAAQAAWGHRWTSAQGDLPIDDHGRLTVAGALWANGLRGLTERQVLDGLGRLAMSGNDWPPTLPELRRAAFDLPSFGDIDTEILTRDTAHRSDFARLVWSFIDGYQHRRVRADEAKRMRREAYEKACDHVMRGGALPARPAAVVEHQSSPKPKGIPATREGRTARLAQLLGEDFRPAPESRN